jgi:cell division protein FtsW (lipid II flippase)
VRFPLRWLHRYRYTWAFLGAGLVALTLLVGRGATLAGGATDQDGPRLWLAWGGFQFQPAEVLKLLLVVFLAGYLTDKREVLGSAVTKLGPLRLPPLPYLAPLVVMLGGSLALLAAQRDLGAALLLYVTGLGMLYLASGRLGYVVLGLGAFLVGAWAMHTVLGVVQLRTAVWLDPWSDADGGGYQNIQALMAIAAGGVMGTGLGFGQPDVIPFAHTDFVYAALVEEMGLAGSLAVLALYGVLFWRGYRTGLRAGSVFGVLLAGGLVFALSVQTFVIGAGILRLIPLTGITLPFLSHGGTSLITSAAAVGLVLRISDETPRGVAA